MYPPKKIKIKSDDNELELITTIPKSRLVTEELHHYKYTKSISKLGEEIKFNNEYLTKMLAFGWEEIK